MCLPYLPITSFPSLHHCYDLLPSFLSLIADEPNLLIQLSITRNIYVFYSDPIFCYPVSPISVPSFDESLDNTVWLSLPKGTKPVQP